MPRQETCSRAERAINDDTYDTSPWKRSTPEALAPEKRSDCPKRLREHEGLGHAVDARWPPQRSSRSVHQSKPAGDTVEYDATVYSARDRASTNHTLEPAGIRLLPRRERQKPRESERPSRVIPKPSVSPTRGSERSHSIHTSDDEIDRPLPAKWRHLVQHLCAASIGNAHNNVCLIRPRATNANNYSTVFPARESPRRTYSNTASTPKEPRTRSSESWGARIQRADEARFRANRLKKRQREDSRPPSRDTKRQCLIISSPPPPTNARHLTWGDLRRMDTPRPLTEPEISPGSYIQASQALRTLEENLALNPGSSEARVKTIFQRHLARAMNRAIGIINDLCANLRSIEIAMCKRPCNRTTHTILQTWPLIRARVIQLLHDIMRLVEYGENPTIYERSYINTIPSKTPFGGRRE